MQRSFDWNVFCQNYWTIFTKILHNIVALVALFNHGYRRRYRILFLNARATKVRSMPLFYTKLVAMAMSVEILEKEVQIDHRHVKHFHMVKRLQKSVQYIRRYLTKYAEPRREHAMQFPLEFSPSKLLDQSSPKFYTI